MRKIDLAYVAGIIDGEGCIGLYQNGKQKNYFIQVAVHMTNEWIIQWLAFSFSGSKNVYTHYRKRANCKPEWAWNITGRKALEFLELIYPYLKLKKAEAEIAINFQRQKTPHKSLTDEQKVFAEAQRILISNLKK